MIFDPHGLRLFFTKAARLGKRYRARAVLALGALAGLGLWLTWESPEPPPDPLGPLAREVSLHGLAKVTVPAAWRIEDGVWAHRARESTPGRYFRNLAAREDVLDPDRVTFLFRANPGAERDDGWLTVTLYRSGLAPPDEAGYRNLLAAAPADCRFRALAARAAAGCLTGPKAPAGERLEQILGSLQRDEAQLAAFFREAARYPDLAARNLEATNRYLTSLGLPAVTRERPAVRGGERVFLRVENGDPPETWLHWLQPLGDIDTARAAWVAQASGEKGSGLERVVVLRWQEGSWGPALPSYLTPDEVAASGIDFGALDRSRAYVFHAGSFILEDGPVDATRLDLPGGSLADSRRALEKRLAKFR